MTQIIRTMFQFGFNDSVNKVILIFKKKSLSLCVIQSMMKYIHGVDMGPVRKPISQVPEDILAKVQANLEKLSFKETCTN